MPDGSAFKVATWWQPITRLLVRHLAVARGTGGHAMTLGTMESSAHLAELVCVANALTGAIHPVGYEWG